MKAIAEKIKGIATRWINKNPTQSSKIEKALPIVLNGHISRKNNTYTVKSQSNPKASYSVIVRSNSASCTCGDFTKRKHRCKHIWSAALLARWAKEVNAEIANLHRQPINS